MTTIKSSMSTKVQFTCKSFLSGDSCLPIVFEFYDGALYIFHSILNIKIKSENEAFYHETFESRLTSVGRYIYKGTFFASISFRYPLRCLISLAER